MFARMKPICAALLAGVALLASAQARADDFSPGYAGASWGVRSNYSVPCYRVGGCDDTSHRSGKLYGGWNLDQRTVFGDHKVTDSLELSTFWLNGKYTPQQGVPATPTREVSTGLAATWASAIELGNGFALNSRIGLSYTRSRAEYRGEGAAGRSSDNYNRLGPTAGLGLSYALNRNWSLQADYDYFPVKVSSNQGKGHINMLSVGAAYHF